VCDRLARRCLTGVALVAAIAAPAASALAAAPAKATPGAGGIGVRLVAMPGDSHVGPLARSYIVARVAPGTNLRRRIMISNTTRSAVVVAVYPAAASLHRGAFAFAAGHSPNALSGWTSVSRDVLRLPPGTATSETVTIHVPKGTSSGERVGVVWATVSAPAPAGGGVTLVNRVGIRMYLSIGPGGAPRSNFAIGPMAAERSATGEPAVVATVRNSGGRTLDISGTLTLSHGPGGLRAGPFPVTLGAALGPKASEPATVRLDGRLPRGPWHAQLRLTSGHLQRTAGTTITFPRAGAASPSGSGGSGSGRRVAEILLVLLVLVAVALWFTRSPNRRRTTRVTTRRST
jgi:hypothetical protein